MILRKNGKKFLGNFWLRIVFFFLIHVFAIKSFIQDLSFFNCFFFVRFFHISAITALISQLTQYLLQGQCCAAHYTLGRSVVA